MPAERFLDSIKRREPENSFGTKGNKVSLDGDRKHLYQDIDLRSALTLTSGR